MASIKKRGDRWQVQVRRQGCAPVSRTFKSKFDAKKWSCQIEGEVNRWGMLPDTKQLSNFDLGLLIKRYRDTISIRKRGCEPETARLNALLRHPISKVTLTKIKPGLFSHYRDERLQTCKPGTVCRDLGLLHHILEVARIEWDISLPKNPVSRIRKPSTPPSRDRRLEENELDRLLEACKQTRNQSIQPLIRFAIETGMHRGELVNIQWRDIDFTSRTLHIPQTKNGHPRTIPLTRGAIAILEQLRGSNEAPVFPLTTNSIKHAWRRLTKRARQIQTTNSCVILGQKPLMGA